MTEEENQKVDEGVIGRVTEKEKSKSRRNDGERDRQRK